VTPEDIAEEFAAFLRSSLPCCGRRRFKRTRTTNLDRIHYWGGIDSVMVHACTACGAAWADVRSRTP
jgi:predicted  nucleic acid-binding Zn-ribbon protein